MEQNRKLFMQTVRRSDNAVVDWYIDTTGEIKHLLPMVGETGQKLDYREIYRLATTYHQPVFINGWTAERLKEQLRYEEHQRDLSHAQDILDTEPDNPVNTMLKAFLDAEEDDEPPFVPDSDPERMERLNAQLQRKVDLQD